MNSQTLHFFAGKGGVGKTTLAAAYALGLSEHAPEEKVLLISSDDVRPLSDLLKRTLSGKPTKLVAGKGEGGLFAAEFDPRPAVESFIKTFRPALDQVVTRGKVLSEDDVRGLLAHLPAGTEELLGLFELMSYLDRGEFHRIVVDLAPSTQSLHLLERPQNLKRFLGVARAAEKAAGKAKKPAAVEGYL